MRASRCVWAALACTGLGSSPQQCAPSQLQRRPVCPQSLASLATHRSAVVVISTRRHLKAHSSRCWLADGGAHFDGVVGRASLVAQCNQRATSTRHRATGVVGDSGDVEEVLPVVRQSLADARCDVREHEREGDRSTVPPYNVQHTRGMQHTAWYVA